VVIRWVGKGDILAEVKYGHVVSADDVTRINQMIRKYVKVARTYDHLQRLVRQSMYLVTLSHAPAWANIKNLRAVRSRAIQEYESTARMANERLAKLNRTERFDTKYGYGKRYD